MILVAIGLWTTSATRYAVPDDDIRAAVAGRWTWSSDSAGCRNAHTIAFSEDGKIMTLASKDSSVSAIDGVTTYDILSVTSSSIRGAIRGETRMTADSTPVVWDLVLTGPDEYRWRRADWSSTPWSFTRPIHRCPEEVEP